MANEADPGIAANQMRQLNGDRITGASAIFQRPLIPHAAARTIALPFNRTIQSET